MQDDYVGLGYLPEAPDEEHIVIDPKPGDNDSVHMIS